MSTARRSTKRNRTDRSPSLSLGTPTPIAPAPKPAAAPSPDSLSARLAAVTGKYADDCRTLVEDHISHVMQSSGG